MKPLGTGPGPALEPTGPVDEHGRPEPDDGSETYGGDPRTAVVAATVQVLDTRGAVAGAGFLVAPDTVVTCAHVVAAAGAAPGKEIEVAFPHLPRSPRLPADVLTEGWRDPAAQDIAVLRLTDPPPDGARGLPLGSAAECRGHRVSSFGYPGQGLPGGRFGYGRAADVLLDGDGAGGLLRLTDADGLARGFGGAPVVDEVTGLVIGMVSALTAPDGQPRGQGVVRVTPAEVLREVWPGLGEDEVCPYRGLEPFTEEHADWFFGRRGAVEQLLAELGGQRRALLLLGPSGAGKSSLVRAGVLPALAAGELPGSDRWRPVVARPGQDLLAGLETAGLPGAATDGVVKATRRLLAEDPSAERLLLVVDQFEEALVQHTPDDHLTGRHRAAVEQLAQAIASDEPVTVVLVMRDDFLPRLAALAPQLMGAAVPGLLTVPARLSRPDLEAIIREPARALGLRVEEGLTERIVTDILAATPSGPRERQAPVTVLPLLELTLSQLWERRADNTLTHRAYERVGGVTGSLATWCEAAMDRLPEGRRATARRMLTALVRPADEIRSVPPTRQRLALADLRALAGGAAGHLAGGRPGGEADEVLRVLTEHRIVITGNTGRLHEPGTGPVAELIHDVLISGWSDLRDWVAADHRFQMWLRRVLDQHALWLEHREAADLLDGTDLADGLEWAGMRGLPPPVHTLLALSRERHESLRRRRRRTRVLLITLAVLAMVAATLAYVQQRNADHTREQAEPQGLRAASWRLALRSAGPPAAGLDSASLPAVAAYRTAPACEAVPSPHAAAEPLSMPRTLGGGEIHAAACHPDGRGPAAGRGDGSALWQDVALPQRAAAVAAICRVPYHDPTPREGAALPRPGTGPVCPEPEPADGR
ncbi:trypsin-like peptidase domain-containing protein [Streptomyces sp. MUM 203J]|uniref:serine protease n=1 Tax=Streptomyces sp. MUM 203J TaxID=2791990 RepID=UPI001F04DCD5|nr:serine protease [Streptomyces sp. MUM 203J]MCH0540022.1 trypsin-like peptidase domain-containing protein [Streptomyces sp. MUM 203J]